MISKRYIYWLVLIFTTFGCFSEKKNKIPFEKSLSDASIKINSIEGNVDGALIIGNGDVNALIYSDSGSIIMNLTKNDIWDARLETLNDPPLPTLDLIKKLGASDTGFPLKNRNSSHVLAKDVIWQGKDSYEAKPYPCPRQAARISIKMGSDPVDFSGETDIQRAVVKINEKTTNENQAVIRALSNKNAFLIETVGNIALEPIISEGIPQADTGESNKTSWLKQVIPGDLDWPGMEFAVAVASGENRKVIAIITSMESGNVVKDAIKLAEEILDTELTLLIKNHESEWENFWTKSGIEIDNQFLQATWYQSLYFLRCFSKPGVQSVGLFAGLINDVPAWHGDYHTNYNIQQTYWGAYPTNHTELAEPYDRLIFEYLSRAKWLSKQIFDMDGAYYPHVMYAYEPSDPGLCKSRNGRQYIHHVWGMTLGVNGFSVQPLWLRYKYDPDPERLKKYVYPVLREIAIFYAEFIEQSEGGETVRLGPSVSPEHWGWTKNLDRNYNGTFDIALFRYTLKAAIEAAQILNQDESLINRFQKALQRIPDYPLYENEQPIVVDVEGAPPIEYNIPVPSTPVFPGDVVSWWSPEEEKQLFSRTIEGLKWNGNNGIFMLAIARARLSMPGSEEWLEAELKKRARPNATFSLNTLIPHHRFNDYGHYTEQFGVAMAISELLLQSVDDIIRVFPALSPGTKAKFADLRTQGGFLVTASKTIKDVEMIKIESLYGGDLRLLSPWEQIEARKENDERYISLEKDKRGVATIKTKAGEVWYFKAFQK